MIEAFDRGPSVEARLQAPAEAADIANGYRLLLGREAGQPEIAARVGQPLDVLLQSLAESAEHRAFVHAALLSGAPFAPDRFAASPSAGDADWLAALSGAPLALEVQASWRALLRQARIALGVLPPAPSAAAPAGLPVSEEHAAAREDVERLYRLVLGREVESDASVASRVGLPLPEVVAGLLASDEFRLRVVSEVVAGTLPPGGDALPIADLRWARARLGLDLAAYAPRGAALASLVEAPAVARALAAQPPAWSPAALVEFVRAQAALDAAAASRPAAIEAIQRLCRNVELLALKDVELAAGGVRFTSDDPNLSFRLDVALNDAPAVELSFAMGGARRRAAGVLYLDYGEGFAAGAIPLTPRGRRLHRALVVRPARVQALRWDPDDQAGEAALISLSARAVPAAELQALMAALPPEELFADAAATPAHADAGLSRRLTTHVHGHGSGRDYADWIAAFEPSPLEAQRRWAAELAALTDTPTIAVLVPLYDTPAPLLREMIESVLNQVYPHWRLCLADDASPSPHVREMVEGYMVQDARIACVFRPRNGHISEASNSALELVDAPWVALLDHDDVLTPDALLAVAGEIAAHPDAQFIYSDEDKLDDAGVRNTPFFKPDFSPELLRAQNYLNHLSVHRTQNVRDAGGWRKGFEGSQDYDLNLRTLERLPPSAVRHIPRVLYHWRAVAGSTALAIGEKDYAVVAGLRALREHVDRMEWDATAGMVPGLPFYRVRYHLPEPAPLVSVIIPTRDRADLLGACVDSMLAHTDHPNFEILIADNGSVEPATFALFARLTADPRVRVVETPGPFNYSRINNEAVAQSRGELVCLLNNDIEVITPGWLSEMAGWALQPRIGCVGAKLYYPNDTIQHAGVTLGLGGVAGHPHKHRARADLGYFGRAAVHHDVSAVTAACLLIRREVWDELGGLDERLSVAFNDVDFCLRVREAGYRNIFTPFAELYHHESPSRGEDVAPEKRARFVAEVEFMHETWAWAMKLDPFYSPSLTRERDDYSLA